MSLHRRSRTTARRLAGTSLVAALAVTGAAVTGFAGSTPAGAGAAQYSVTTLHFLVHVGPQRTQACDIVGQVYLPRGASAAHRVPAILTTNGFGGSDADQAPFAKTEAQRGYAVLSYSGLGFGGSACKITLDDPDYDGVAARQLVTYLGGGPGVAFTDAKHTHPAPRLNAIVHDRRDHDGHRRTYDPRVGMWGGSYGGEIQFAAADKDPRIDALNPQITWNDLSYSLGPNNATAPGDVTTSPGATKLTWGLLFSSVGVVDGVRYGSADPYRNVGCPNFATFVCGALVTGGTTGYFQPSDIAKFRHASVESYIKNIKIPVLLDQGETDTLFNLNEAVATYNALRRQHTPVAMLWRDQGHSGGNPSKAGLRYENARIQTWFDHYLKGKEVSTGPRFAYYRDWNGTFATSSGYPVGHALVYRLSGGSATAGGDLIRTGKPRSGTQSFTTPPFGPPTTLSDLDAIGGQVPQGTLPSAPDTNAPGTYASWLSRALPHTVDVVGPPRLTVTISAPTANATAAQGPAGQPVLFAKIYDVSKDGKASLIHGLVAPFRVVHPKQAVHVTLPAIAHRFAAGDRIRIVVAGGDTNYRGGLTPTPVSITSGAGGQVLSLPVVHS